MANTNDSLKNQVAEAFPDFEVSVEGSSTALSPFRVTLRKEGKKDVVVETSMSFKDLVETLARKVK